MIIEAFPLVPLVAGMHVGRWRLRVCSVLCGLEIIDWVVVVIGLEVVAIGLEVDGMFGVLAQ